MVIGLSHRTSTPRVQAESAISQPQDGWKLEIGWCGRWHWMVLCISLGGASTFSCLGQKSGVVLYSLPFLSSSPISLTTTLTCTLCVVSNLTISLLPTQKQLLLNDNRSVDLCVSASGDWAMGCLFGIFCGVQETLLWALRLSVGSSAVSSFCIAYSWFKKFWPHPLYGSRIRLSD